MPREGKIHQVEEIMGRIRLVAFVGNDINDLPCLERVALPIVVQDSYQELLSTALYQTKRPGGQGAVREICDLFEQALAKDKS